MIDSALLVLRLGVGAVFVIHAAGKLTRRGRRRAAAWFSSLGLTPGHVHAAAAAFGELAVGLGLAAGLLTSYAAAGLVALMLIATLRVTGSHGFLAERGGWEYNGVLIMIAAVLALAGPGRWSLDACFSVPGAGVSGLLIAVVGGGAGAGAFLLATRTRPAVAAETS